MKHGSPHGLSKCLWAVHGTKVACMTRQALGAISDRQMLHRSESTALGAAGVAHRATPSDAFEEPHGNPLCTIFIAGPAAAAKYVVGARVTTGAGRW